jgi:hypothetical protein
LLRFARNDGITPFCKPSLERLEIEILESVSSGAIQAALALTRNFRPDTKLAMPMRTPGRRRRGIGDLKFDFVGRERKWAR